MMSRVCLPRVCRLLALVLLVTALSIAGPVSPAAAQPPDSIPRTVIRLYTPYFSGAVNPELTPVAAETGPCSPSLIAGTVREDAYACFASNGQSFDPCFVTDIGPAELPLVCTSNGPWSQDVITFLASTPPPLRDAPPMSDTPWALELANGARCLRWIGSGAAVAGLALTYRCGDDAWVLGEPDRSEPVWLALYKDTRYFAEQVPVSIAWY